MFCPECGRDLKENEVCHCLEEVHEQPKVIGIVDDTPRFGALDNKIYEDNLEQMKKEFEKEQKNKKERKNKNEKKKS